MRMKSVSALFLVLGGFALIAFETSFYGAVAAGGSSPNESVNANGCRENEVDGADPSLTARTTAR